MVVVGVAREKLCVCVCQCMREFTGLPRRVVSEIRLDSDLEVYLS